MLIKQQTKLNNNDKLRSGIVSDVRRTKVHLPYKITNGFNPIRKIETTVHAFRVLSMAGTPSTVHITRFRALWLGLDLKSSKRCCARSVRVCGIKMARPINENVVIDGQPR